MELTKTTDAGCCLTSTQVRFWRNKEDFWQFSFGSISFLCLNQQAAQQGWTSQINSQWFLWELISEWRLCLLLKSVIFWWRLGRATAAAQLCWRGLHWFLKPCPLPTYLLLTVGLYSFFNNLSRWKCCAAVWLIEDKSPEKLFLSILVPAAAISCKH